MAKLAAGVKYGLSSQNTFYNNKELVLVKLTDSAQRAIESYLRNPSTFDKNPTIQFHGNKGQIIFPSHQSNFSFSVSSNQDGGFECIQQTDPKTLESLGTLPWKMQIQANDDVYETTKQRLHVVEENNKNKATRVLKSNEPVRKRMKINPPSSVRAPSLSSHLNMNSSSKLQETKISRTSTNQPSRFSSSNKFTNSNLTGSSFKPNDQKKFSNVIGRPLKERIIHLLALKPFKKIELHDRINREGIKEKDKKSIERTLKEISYLKDNAYHLKRYLWNDVQEDWPFYSDQEKTILKRRKPQNLTPPGSSDCASNGSNEENNTNSFQVLDKPGASANSVSFNKTTFSNSNTSIYCNSAQHQRKQNQEQKQNCVINGKKIDNRYEKSSSSDLLDFKLMDYEDVDKESQKSLDVKTNEKVRDNKYQQNHYNHLDSANKQYSSGSLDIPKNGIIPNSPSTFSTPTSNDEDCTDYKSNYTTINSYEQRKRYKVEYLEGKEEYDQLSTQMTLVNKKYQDLTEKWRRIQQEFGKNDPQAEEVKAQIYREYALDKDFKTRYEYVKLKQNHILSLIEDYDSRQ